jgi:hypothetical protein
MVVALIVAASIASLNVTVTGALADAFVAPFAGDVDTTDGGASSRVVNDQNPGEASVRSRAFPEMSFAPAVTVAVMLVELGHGFVGLNTATWVAAL